MTHAKRGVEGFRYDGVGGNLAVELGLGQQSHSAIDAGFTDGVAFQQDGLSPLRIGSWLEMN